MDTVIIGVSPNYKIFIGTGSMHIQEFHVSANNETEALALIADYCEENEMHWLYADYYEIFDLCDVGETVSEYAARQDLTECGEHGVYMQIKGIEAI